MPIRLAHISDPHLTTTGLDWRWRDWLSKRSFSWLNLHAFGRGKHFAQADHVLQRLGSELAERNYDRVVFTGDASALGFDAEFRHTARLLGVERLPGLAVPGNHDYCTRAAASSGAFARRFAMWQHGQRADAETYPFAQRVGDLWLVAVNSCKGNRWFWDASGRTGRGQLERLRRLLADLPAGPRILVTHYPVCIADGRGEGTAHGLLDLRATIDLAAAGGVVIWLPGHRHIFYRFQRPSVAPFPVICAGSATQTGLWSYGEYVIGGDRLQGMKRMFDPQTDSFRDDVRFELTLESVSA